jgi:hypothetical protein
MPRRRVAIGPPREYLAIDWNAWTRVNFSKKINVLEAAEADSAS